MRNLDEAMRELDARKERQLKDCVISVVRFHGPASETQGVALSPQECTAIGAEYPYVLVMERGDRSLHHSLSSERIAGFAYEAIRDIIRRMVKLALTLHSKGLAHNDLKVKRSFFPLFERHNCVRITIYSVAWALFCSFGTSVCPKQAPQHYATSGSGNHFRPHLPVFMVQMPPGKYSIVYYDICNQQ